MNGKSLFDEYNPATATTGPVPDTPAEAPAQASSPATTEVAPIDAAPAPVIDSTPIIESPILESNVEVAQTPVEEATPAVQAEVPNTAPELPVMESAPAEEVAQEIPVQTETQATAQELPVMESLPLEEASPAVQAETPSTAPELPVMEGAPAQEVVQEAPVQTEVPSAPVQETVSVPSAPVSQENAPLEEVVPSVPVNNEVKTETVVENNIPSLPEVGTGSEVPAPPVVTETTNPILDPPITNPSALEPQAQVVAATSTVTPMPIPTPMPSQSVPEPQVAPQPQPMQNNYNNAPQPQPMQNTYSNAPQQSAPKKKMGGIDDDVLVRGYVGKKYDKISSKLFNFPAFFFTSLYLFYRKMFGLGVLVFIISFAIMNFVNIPGIFIVVNILLGLSFNKLYMSSVRKKVAKLKEKNQYMRMEDIKDMCISKGGTSFGLVILGIIVEGLIGFVVGILMVIFGIAGIFGDLFSGFKFDFNFNFNDNSQNEEYDGTFIYNTNIKMISEFSVDIPGKFNDESEEYDYEFSYRGKEGVFNECSFKLFAPTRYKEAEKLINEMHDFHIDSEPTDVTYETYNGVKWTTFNYTDSIGQTYYYGTNKGKKVYIFTYDINVEAPEDCAGYREMVLKSLRSK